MVAIRSGFNTRDSLAIDINLFLIEKLILAPRRRDKRRRRDAENDLKKVEKKSLCFEYALYYHIDLSVYFFIFAFLCVPASLRENCFSVPNFHSSVCSRNTTIGRCLRIETDADSPTMTTSRMVAVAMIRLSPGKNR